MNLLDELRKLGVSVDEGVKRLGGSAAIYKKMLKTFAKMMKEYAVEPDYDGKDYEDIIEKAYAIKGASGNLSVTVRWWICCAKDNRKKRGGFL